MARHSAFDGGEGGGEGGGNGGGDGGGGEGGGLGGGGEGDDGGLTQTLKPFALTEPSVRHVMVPDVGTKPTGPRSPQYLPSLTRR